MRRKNVLVRLAVFVMTLALGLPVSTVMNPTLAKVSIFDESESYECIKMMIEYYEHQDEYKKKFKSDYENEFSYIVGGAYEDFTQFIFASLFEHGVWVDRIDEVKAAGYWEENYVPPFDDVDLNSKCQVNWLDDAGVYKNTIYAYEARHWWQTAYDLMPTGYTPSTCKISQTFKPLKYYGPDAYMQQVGIKNYEKSLELYGKANSHTSDMTFDKTNSVWLDAEERPNDYIIMHNGEVVTEDVEDYYENPQDYKESDGSDIDYDEDSVESILYPLEPDYVDQAFEKKSSSTDTPSKEPESGKTPERPAEEKKEETPTTPTKPSVPATSQHVHSYREEVVEPTCTEAGYITYICKTCGSSYQEETEAAGHSFIEERLEATCMSAGYVKKTCKNCMITEEEVIPVGAHEWALEKETESTCEMAGYAGYICLECGECETEEKPLAEHTFELTKRVDATCQMEGMDVYTCSVCGYEKESVFPVSEHNPVTEETDKLLVTKCLDCGAVMSVEDNSESYEYILIIGIVAIILVLAGGATALVVIRKKR